MVHIMKVKQSLVTKHNQQNLVSFQAQSFFKDKWRYAFWLMGDGWLVTIKTCYQYTIMDYMFFLHIITSFYQYTFSLIFSSSIFNHNNKFIKVWFTTFKIITNIVHIHLILLYHIIYIYHRFARGSHMFIQVLWNISWTKNEHIWTGHQKPPLF